MYAYNKSVKSTVAEKVPCEQKDYRQHGLIKQRHTLTKV